MTNALELVPAFRRQISVYTHGETTSDSALAGYISDAVQALMYRWDKEYSIEFNAPQTYFISPDVEQRDIRPIILMASIIYKMGVVSSVSFQDGDFSYNPRGAAANLAADKEELLNYVPSKRLAVPSVGQFLGFDNWINPESYVWMALNYL